MRNTGIFPLLRKVAPFLYWFYIIFLRRVILYDHIHLIASPQSCMGHSVDGRLSFSKGCAIIKCAKNVQKMRKNRRKKE